MTHAARIAAIKRLRKAASAAIGAPEVEVLTKYRRGYNAQGAIVSMEFMGTKVVQSKPYRRLESTWRAFPECERDDAVPSPQDVLAICDRMEREEEEDRKFCEAMKGTI